MDLDCPAQDPGQMHRHCIANQTGQPREWARGRRRRERIVARKALQESAFAQREGAVLCRMPEATAAELRELGGEGWGWLVPFHTAVHSMERASAPTAVAGRYEAVGPIRPSAARTRSLDALQIERREPPGPVQNILRIDGACGACLQ